MLDTESVRRLGSCNSICNRSAKLAIYMPELAAAVDRHSGTLSRGDDPNWKLEIRTSDEACGAPGQKLVELHENPNFEV